MYSLFNIHFSWISVYLFLLTSPFNCNCWQTWKYSSHAFFYIVNTFLNTNIQIMVSLSPSPPRSNSKLSFSLFLKKKQGAVLSFLRTHILLNSVLFLFHTQHIFDQIIVIVAIFVSLFNFCIELIISFSPLISVWPSYVPTTIFPL